ncbi:hypothetical protein ACQ4PT_056170 [Festuca glaucescens]
MAKRKRKTKHLDGTNVKNRNSRKSKTQLSDLPMDILSSIISRLQINEAIRTSILSRHWNHVWCHHTNLNFVRSTMMPRDSNLYSSPAVKRRKQRVFIKRVDDVLLQHSGAGVEHISIHFDLDGSRTADVNRWITFVIGSKTKALSLRLLYHAPEYLLERELDDSIELYSFPFQLFDAGNGSHLKFLLLTSISVKVPANFEGFTKLKKLYLCDLRIADEDLQHLLSKCSLLEFLSVTYCKTIIGLRVSHPASHLEQLEVSSCSSLREIELNNDLTILEYRGHPISFISNGNPCLTNIFIKLSQADTSIKHLFTELPGTLPPPNAPTSGFGGLERDISSTRHPQFVSLRSLILEMDIFAPPRTKPDVLDVAYLLQAAPFIERLEFHMFVRYGHKPYRREHANDNELRSLSPHPHPHLKAVRITGFFGHKDQLELAFYILANSPKLESMVIDPTVVILNPRDEALYLPDDCVFLDGYKIATGFLRDTDERHVVEVVSICPSTNILMSLRKRLLLSHRLTK